jgi:hypothetical protein
MPLDPLQERIARMALRQLTGARRGWPSAIQPGPGAESEVADDRGLDLHEFVMAKKMDGVAMDERGAMSVARPPTQPSRCL